MAAQTQPQAAVILDHGACGAHRRERDRRLRCHRLGGGEQGERRIAQAAHRPQRLPPAEAEASERVGLGQPLERGDGHVGVPGNRRD